MRICAHTPERHPSVRFRAMLVRLRVGPSYDARHLLASAVAGGTIRACPGMLCVCDVRVSVQRLHASLTMGLVGMVCSSKAMRALHLLSKRLLSCSASTGSANLCGTSRVRARTGCRVAVGPDVHMRERHSSSDSSNSRERKRWASSLAHTEA